MAESGLRATGPVAPVTSGMRVWNASLSGERVAFDTNFPQVNLMRANADTSRAQLTGKPVPFTSDDAVNFVPAIVEDAHTALYYSTRNGVGEVIRRDMKTGQETALPIPLTGRMDLSASPDGRWVAWSDGHDSIYYSPVANFQAAKLCETCGFPVGWLPGGSSLLISTRRDGRGALIRHDVQSNERQLILQDEGHGKAYPVARSARVSPDGKWLAFLWGEMGAETFRIYIAPLDRQTPLEQKHWVFVLEERFWGNFGWSPGGQWLYFARQGGRDLAAIPLNPQTKYPTGPPVNVHRLPENHFFESGLTVLRDSIVYSEMTPPESNIWLQDLRR